LAVVVAGVVAVMPDGALLAAGGAIGRVTPGDTCGPAAVAAAGACGVVLAVGVASPATVSGSVLGAALAPAGGAVLARVRDVAVFARGLAAVVPDRAAGVFFALVPGVVPDREPAAVVFDRAPDPDPVGRVPAAVNPEAPAPALVPSVADGRDSGPAASALPWSCSAEAALAARGRLAARVWLSVPAGCLLVARLGAGPVPLPVEPSPGVPFSEVTAP
jgi:hypothetical protein